MCHLPLAFHKKAGPAARAAVAAQLQDKFWEYNTILFDNMKALEDANLEAYAKQAGLNVEQWKKDFASPLVKAHVDHQAALGASLGVRGTPNFFVNGENVRGAKPFPDFQKIIDTKLAEAKKEEAAGTALKDLHGKLTASAVGGKYKMFVVDGKKPVAPPPPKPPEPLAEKAVDLPIGDSPRMGKGDKVVITEFSDFQ